MLVSAFETLICMKEGTFVPPEDESCWVAFCTIVGSSIKEDAALLATGGPGETNLRWDGVICVDMLTGEYEIFDRGDDVEKTFCVNDDIFVFCIVGLLWFIIRFVFCIAGLLWFITKFFLLPNPDIPE